MKRARASFDAENNELWWDIRRARHAGELPRLDCNRCNGTGEVVWHRTRSEPLHGQARRYGKKPFREFRTSVSVEPCVCLFQPARRKAVRESTALIGLFTAMAALG